MASVPQRVPTVEQVRGVLQGLGYPGLCKLADASGVHIGTLNKIRAGHHDPQLGTVVRFWPYLPRAALRITV